MSVRSLARHVVHTMRTWARYVVLLLTVAAVATYLYLGSRPNGDDDEHETEQDYKKWTRQRHQLLLDPNDDKAKGHADVMVENPKVPGQRNFAFRLGMKRPDRTWNGQGFAGEVEKHQAAYSNMKNTGKEGRLVGRAQCTPRHNITFLKVHKTGSSTLQNIFLRFGQRHKLNFVLPPQGHHLGFPDFFDRRHMLPVENGVYNIFCHHTRFSQVIIDIMPPNAVYISILRDPVHVFESAFTYFKIDYHVGMSNDPDAMIKFLEDPFHYYKSAQNIVHMRNNMLYDFGVPTIKFDDTDFLKQAIELIDKQFSLILIAEYFEESLILLQDVLCWKMEDMVVFKMNSRSQSSVSALETGVQQKIRTWNSGDVMLYEHFNKTLWRKIEEYGREKMAKEVKELQALTEQYYRLCIETDSADRKDGAFDVWQPPGVKINAFVLKDSAYNNPVCENMVRPEIAYTAMLREAQFPHLSFRKFKHNMKRRRPT